MEGSKVDFTLNNVKLFSHNIQENIYGNVVGLLFSSSTNIILNLDKTSINENRPTAFVIMKFDKDYEDLYKLVIEPVCIENGYDVFKANEIFYPSGILHDIINYISTSSLIIADVTLDNPNVFYELGYAHALGKPTIILAEKTKRDGSLPFDISGYRTIFYENTIGGKAQVETILKKFIANINR